MARTSRRDEKGPGNRGTGIGQEDRRQGQTVQDRIADEQTGGRRRLDLVDPGREEEDQTEFGEEQDHEQRAGDNRPGQAAAGGEIGDDAGQSEAHGHPVEDLGEEDARGLLARLGDGDLPGVFVHWMLLKWW